MKIAYVGNFSQAHCTEVHLAATLEDLGHQVVRLQENELSPTWAADIADDTDLVLYTRTWGEFVTLEDLALLRGRKIPTASYHLDLYVGLKREDGLIDDPFWRTDYVFTPDGDPVSQAVFKSKGINHHYIKPGVYKPECYMKSLAKYRGTPGQWDVPKGEPLFDIPGYEHDVIFVGGGSPTGEGPQYGHPEWKYRGELLKWLKETYGDKYSKYGYPDETVRNDPLNQLYGSSKVVIGDSLCLQNFTHPYYWSDRVYETIGRGGFIIHPYIKGLEEEFIDGETIVFYEYGNFDQLKEKIDYYLEHDEERERIRHAGFEFVKNNATYTNRLQQMLEIIFPKTIAGYSIDPPAMADYIHGESIRISLGAGTEPEEGFVNVDIVSLPGIDVVHNLMHFPYPFADNSANYIKAKDLIEHLATHLHDGRSTILAFIEECYRILEPGGTLWIQTPGHNADFLWIDPTHVRGFDVRSMDFFDPETDFGRSTGFYSDAKFKVKATELENKNLQFEMVKI